MAMEAGEIQEGEPMGLFGNPKSSVEKKAAEFDFGERKELAGPLPVVENLVETVQWLENARQKVSSGNASCCLVVCAPNSIDGVAMELTVGEIANRFAHSLRSYDAIFRHGRDKLLVALPHVKPSDAPAVLQRLKAIIARLPFKLPNQSVDISVTVSLGGVMMDSSPVQELINRADKAMEAGRISGNYTCMWTSDLH
ncbi:MAG: diguanylate cyclase [Rhodospirillales bacterium]|nr:MAG: diguanylate cyclase [Rhodospirillales bacterium]